MTILITVGGRRHRPRGILNALALSVPLAVLAGCTSPDEYSGAIGKFSAATGSAATSLHSLNASVTQDYKAFLDDHLATNSRSALKQTSDDCDIKAERCRLELISSEPDLNGQKYPPDPVLSNLVAVMDGIVLYAQGLSDLMADKSAEDAQVHVNAALGSAEALAGTVVALKGGDPANLPSFAAEVGAGVNWLAEQYVNRVKLNGLKHATKHADPVIQDATGLFATAAAIAAEFEGISLTEEFRTKMVDYQNERSSGTKRDRAVTAAVKLDTFLRAKPSQTFAKLGEAHAALTASLNDPEVSVVRMLAKIEAFVAEAEKFKKIVEDLISVAEGGQGSE